METPLGWESTGLLADEQRGACQAGTPAQCEDRGRRGADGADGRACLRPHILGLDPEGRGAALTWGSCPGVCWGCDAG